VNFNRSYRSAFLVLCVLLAHPLFAQTASTIDLVALVTPAAVSESSSTSATPDLSSATTATAATSGGKEAAPETATKAFSAVGIDVKIGTGGIGVDIATPLARKFNLRGTGSYFKYNTSITENYVTYGGDIQLAAGALSLDWFPFGGGFRLSAGVVAYNGNELTGNAALNPNESFTLNGTTYYSSATDPLHASASLRLGAKAGPQFGIGWGNIVPRKANKHFSVPIELGFIYVGYPNVDLGFTGSTCNEFGTACQDVQNNPTFQQDLAAQKSKYRDDLSPLRFYPIASIGFGYKF
jgi:hypothetical protein